MATPFDTALRVQRRGMDAIRLSLLAEAVREAEVQAQVRALGVHIIEERAVAAGDWQLAAHPYGARVRARVTQLETEGRRVAARLDGLRDEALAACGQMQAITQAAAGYGATLQRQARTSEQTQADDISGGRAASALRAGTRRVSAG
jgi:hypothetical protein